MFNHVKKVVKFRKDMQLNYLKRKKIFDLQNKLYARRIYLSYHLSFCYAG